MKKILLLFLFILAIACTKPPVETLSKPNLLLIVVEATGGKITDKTVDGINLFKPQKDRLLVWKWQKTWAVRQGDYKLTNTNEENWKGDPSKQYIAPIVDNLELKLFNVETDPGERIDLAKTNPAKVKELKTAYDTWCKENLGKY